PAIAGEVSGSGSRFAFDYKGADSAIAINRLLKDGARVAFDGPSHVAVSGVARSKVEQVAKELGLNVSAGPEASRTKNGGSSKEQCAFHEPRPAKSQPLTGGNIEASGERWGRQHEPVQPSHV